MVSVVLATLAWSVTSEDKEIARAHDGRTLRLESFPDSRRS